MGSIKDYSELIRLIPVSNQSAKVKKEVWEKYSYKDEIKDAFFGSKEIVEISRADVHSERDIAKKIIMILMWGYPTGGRGNNIEKILEKMDVLIPLLLSVNGKNLTKEKAKSIIAEYENIPGMGISTWSKFLYFFNVSVDSRKCQIYDLRIVDSLNKKQFSELDIQKWTQNINHYYQYIELVNDLAESISVLPEQVELFLFYFNLYYKFTTE
ncbi:MAG: hypothetical protein IKF90_08865 [Parasporobacterium sp.]|nr:hypothetical protein [Parasporobacterium sp.]